MLARTDNKTCRIGVNVMNWNNLTHLPTINGVTLKGNDQISENFTLETLGFLPMSDLGINELFRSVMGYNHVQANFHDPDFTNVRSIER